VPVSAWNPYSFGWTGVQEDILPRYDFDTNSDVASHADWPVTVIFFGYGASVSAAKNLLWSGGLGSSLWYRCTDNGYNWYWNQDEGAKTASTPPDWDAWHCRVYAVNDYWNYNSTFGYYVVGTTHRDWHGKNGGAPPYYTGYSYDAMVQVTNKAAETVGFDNIVLNYFNMWNYEPTREEGSLYIHVWQKPDGYVRGVRMN
jgi:hypothetical protein